MKIFLLTILLTILLFIIIHIIVKLLEKLCEFTENISYEKTNNIKNEAIKNKWQFKITSKNKYKKLRFNKKNNKLYWYETTTIINQTNSFNYDSCDNSSISSSSCNI